MCYALRLAAGYLLFVALLFPASLFADSVTVTLTAEVASTNQNVPPPNTGGGGGGSGGGNVALPMNTAYVDSAAFRGLAYPGSIISLLQNGIIVAEVPASPNGTFEMKVRGLSTGTYTFGIRAEDAQSRISTVQVFTVFISTGVSVTVEDIFIAPTITTDKVEVKKGDPIVILGTSAPNAKVTISIHSATEIVKKVISNANGGWIYKLDTTDLEMGEHEAKALAITEDDLSVYSSVESFIVGTQNMPRQASQSTNRKCDLNNDTRVNLLDFSIMAFWYKRAGFPEKIDLNSDKKIDLSDVSILAYCWTG